MDIASQRVVSIEADGLGSPMPHANLLDNSLNLLPPLRRLEQVVHQPQPSVCSINFGAYTGKKYAVCVFESRDEPPLVAVSLDSGEPLWSLPLDVLPAAYVNRWISGVLLAKLHCADGQVLRRVYAANRAEMICVDDGGRICWRRSAAELVGGHGEVLGLVRCIRFTPDGALVFATNHGQVVKVDPLTGETLDLCLLESSALVEGRRVSGRFTVMQSPILVGDEMYLEGAFVPHEPALREHPLRPVCLLRVSLSSGGPSRPAGRGVRLAEPAADGTAPDRLVVGVVGDGRQGGSPSAVLGEDGAPVVILNAYQPQASGELRWGLRGATVRGGELAELWRADVDGVADSNIAAAPAFDPVTGTYLAPTKEAMLIIGDATERRGAIGLDTFARAEALLAPDVRRHCLAAELSSPLSLARDPDDKAFVCYAAMAVMTAYDERPYSFLTAFEVVPETAELRPLWSGSLALDAAGEPAPAVRSFSQPALFSYGETPTQTGIIMGSCFDGITIFR